MAAAMAPRRDPRERRPARRPGSQRRPLRPPTRPAGGTKRPSKKEPMRVILDTDSQKRDYPTHKLEGKRKVVGTPPRKSPAAPVPRRIPLTKEQIRVGEVLLAEGPITSDSVRRQIENAGLQNSLLAKAVAASGHAPESEVITLLLTGYRIPKVKLSNYRIPEEALALIPPVLARRHKVVPLGQIGSIICVAVGSIFQLEVSVVEEIRQKTGCMVKVFQSTPDDVEVAVKRFYPERKKREVVAAVPVAPDVVESVSAESVPYEDTAEYWDELYASAGPLKAIRLED